MPSEGIDDDPKARVCVVKLGGSALASDHWPTRLRQWLHREVAARDDTHFVLLVGGGTLVDALRELDARTPLGDRAAHWAAIRLMDVNAGIVAALLPEVPLCDDYEELKERASQPGVTIFCAYQFMRRVEPHRPGVRLPATWDVTSDSIAARLAIVLAAAELVLIKSCPSPYNTNLSIAALAMANVVDDFFPCLTHELPRLRVSTLQAIA